MAKHVFNVKLPPENKSGDDHPPAARFAAGIDVHKYYVTACVAARIDQGNHFERAALQEFKSNPRGLGALARFLAKYPLQAIVMEATGVYTAPVKASLEAFAGWTRRPLILVFNPTEIKQFPGQIHEDGADAFAMARFALMGLLRPSFIPEGTIRDLRELTREAGTMTKETTRAKNRIKRVLAAWGLALPRLNLETDWPLDLFRALDWAEGDFGKALRCMKSGEFPIPASTCRVLDHRAIDLEQFEKVVLPPPAREVLRGYLLSLAASEVLIAHLAKEVEKIVAINPAKEVVIEQIAAISGITPFSATSIIAEIGDISRFPSVKQFLTYAGCAPTIHQSGTKTVHGKLTKRANPYLKRKFFWIGRIITTSAKEDSDIKAYASAQRQRHPSKQENRLVYANTGAKVARVVYLLLHDAKSYVMKYQGSPAQEIPAGFAQEIVSSAFQFREIRKRTRQFVNYLNRVKAEAPAKFKVVAEAFEKITWM